MKPISLPRRSAYSTGKSTGLASALVLGRTMMGEFGFIALGAVVG